MAVDGAGTDADPFVLEAQLCFALQSASRAMVACYRHGLDALGLTYSQYTVLLLLWEEGPVSLGHLARRLHSDSGTLSPLLKRLETQGLVTRRRRADDERVLEVAPTADADRLRDSVDSVRRRVAAVTGLGAEELDRLRSSLDEITDRLRAAQADLEASASSDEPGPH